MRIFRVHNCKVCGCDDPEVLIKEKPFLVCPCCRCANFSEGYIYEICLPDTNGAAIISPHFIKYTKE